MNSKELTNTFMMISSRKNPLIFKVFVQKSISVQTIDNKFFFYFKSS